MSDISARRTVRHEIKAQEMHKLGCARVCVTVNRFQKSGSSLTVYAEGAQVSFGVTLSKLATRLLADAFADAADALDEFDERCPSCGGSGEVETGGRSANDPFRERQTCQECK